MSENAKIIQKVKGLLALAKDGKNDEESQSAFLLAQKLMIKHSIDKTEVEDTELDEGMLGSINAESVTIYKRTYWWENTLAKIIAENFRVKKYSKSRNNRSCIMFYGYGRDLELAKEMFILAYEALTYHTNEYAEAYYDERGVKRSAYLTRSIKASYQQGFLEGLEEKFDEQVAQLREVYEVLVLIPEEVEDAYKEHSKKFKTVTFGTSTPVITEAKQSGYDTAKSIDFTKSTIRGAE